MSSVSGLLNQIKSFNLINFNNISGNVEWLNICIQYFQRREKTEDMAQRKKENAETEWVL